MSLLSLDGICKEYGTRILLDGVSLRVSRGERFCLVGPNGSGKTTLLRIAMGLDVADSGTIEVAKRAKVGYLSQNLDEVETGSAFDGAAKAYEEVYRLERRLRELESKMADIDSEADANSLLGEYSRLTSRFESMDGYNVDTKVKQTLMGLGLREEALGMDVGTLSGGERMRVALARILLDEPELLILDEPTNHLDINATEWLESFLIEFDGAVMVVSHDRYFLDRIATRTAYLENGKLFEIGGNYSTYLEQTAVIQAHQHDESRRLARALRQNEELVRRFYATSKVGQAKSREKAGERLRKELAEVKEQQRSGKAPPRFSFVKSKHRSAEVASAQSFSKKFGNVVIFKDTSFLIRGGEHIGLIGPNGCGKTTLINILMGVDTDFQGKARLGNWVRYAYMGQDITFLDESVSVMEELCSKKDLREPEARQYLSRFLFYGDDVDKKISVLSGGERVRLTVACMMLDEPDCLILDEPTNHLDMPAREALEGAIQAFDGTVIAISHDRYFLNKCAHRILACEDVSINSYDGNYEFYRRTRMNQRVGASGIGSVRVGKRNTGKARQSKVREASHLNAVDLEKMIARAETRMKELEESFGDGASHNAYSEYGDLAQQLDVLYEAWEKVMQ